MPPLDLKRVSEILSAVIDTPPLLRGPILKQLCADDEPLHAHLATLLRDLEADDFLSTPMLSLADDADPAPLTSQRIGPYELLRLLGEGGMGSVYEARQDNPRRLVAVKILRAGLFSSESLRRFMRESQVLGMLHHPGIAQVYEAGAADTPVGRVPYFAMELIRGLPLAAFLAAHNLTTRAKLSLLAQICDAVEHAHLHAVVHRDLKPANIMVESAHPESDPAPKILDFGVARAAAGLIPSGTTLQTGAGQIIGTLPYMSPEQVAGDPSRIDARSDVYSLGVIAYEMLAGRLPLDVAARPLADAARSILHHEPTRLRSLDSRFAGDIDTLVAKAMEKDPARRYQSAAALAADIRRFLSDEPIVARPATHLYQLRKFARRNRTLVAGATATFLTLLAGVATTAFWAVRATERRSLAEQRADELQRKAYHASVAAAQAALERGQSTTARVHLDRAHETLRGWEWQYLDNQVDRSDRTIPVVKAGYSSAALGGEFAVMSGVSRMQLLNWRTGELLHCEPAVGPTLYSFAMSPRNDRFLVCGELTSALWHAHTGALIKLFPNESRFESSPFAPDGSFLVLGAANPRRVLFIDSDDASTLKHLDLQSVQRVFPTLSPDGRNLLVEVKDKQTALIRLDDMQTQWTFPGVQPRFFPDAQTVVLFTGIEDKDTQLRVVDAASGRELRSLRLEHEPIARGGSTSSILSPSPDGSVLAHLTVSGAIRLLDSRDLTTLGSLAGLPPRIGGIYNGVAFSADGQWAAGYSRHDEIKVWNIQRSAAWFQLPTREELASTAAAVSPDASVAITGNWGQIVAWNLITGAPLWAVSPSFEFVNALAFSPDGKLAYVGGDRGNLLVLDARSGSLVHSAAPNAVMPFSSAWCRSLATSSSGRLFACFADGTLMSLDPQTLECIARSDLGARGTEIRIAPSGDRLACIADTSPPRVIIADTASLAPIAHIDVPGALSIAWSHDGTLLAVGRAGGVLLLTPDARPRSEMLGATGGQSAVCFSADDTRVIAGSGEGAVSLWLTASSDLALELPLPRQESCFAVAFDAGNSAIRVVTAAAATLSFELDKPDESTARARDTARRGRDLYRRCKIAGAFLPETLDAIERSAGLDPAVKAEAIRQAGLLCEHPAWLNNQAYTRVISVPDAPTLQRAIRENAAARAGCSDPFATLTHGKILHRAGRFGEAIDSLKQADAALRAIRPQWNNGPPEIAALLGICEAQLGHHAEAEKWFALFDLVVAEPRYLGSDEAIRFGALVAEARKSLR